MMNDEFGKYLDMIMSMSLDCHQGGLSKEAYLTIIKMTAEVMNEKFGEKK